METKLVTRERREELRIGLRAVHDDLQTVDELSRQERVASANALKCLRKKLRIVIEDQDTYQN